MVGQSIMFKIETGKDKLAMLSGESRTVGITIDPNKLTNTEVSFRYTSSKYLTKKMPLPYIIQEKYIQ